MLPKWDVRGGGKIIEIWSGGKKKEGDCRVRPRWGLGEPHEQDSLVFQLWRKSLSRSGLFLVESRENEFQSITRSFGP